LIRQKPFFLNEINSNSLGSPANHKLLQSLRPKHWFAAHLHVGFQALVKHNGKGETEKSTSAVTDLVPSQTVKASYKEDDDAPQNDGAQPKEDDNSNGNGTQPNEEKDDNNGNESKAETDSSAMQFCQPVSTEEVPATKFISLDKCLPGKACLAIAHLEPSSPATATNDEESPKLQCDPEWLAILRNTHQCTDPNSNVPRSFPSVSKEDLEWVQANNKAGPIPMNFQMTAPPPPPTRPRFPPPPFPRMGNPQTDDFLQRMELEHILTIPHEPIVNTGGSRPVVGDKNEIDLDDEEAPVAMDENEIDINEEDEEVPVAADENEIDIDDDEEEAPADNNEIEIENEGNGDVNDAASEDVPLKKQRLEEGNS